MPTLLTQNLPSIAAKTADSAKLANGSTQFHGGLGGGGSSPKFGEVLSRETDRKASREPAVRETSRREDPARVDETRESERPAATKTEAPAKPSQKRDAKAKPTDQAENGSEQEVATADGAVTTAEKVGTESNAADADIAVSLSEEVIAINDAATDAADGVQAADVKVVDAAALQQNQTVAAVATPPTATAEQPIVAEDSAVIALDETATTADSPVNRANVPAPSASSNQPSAAPIAQNEPSGVIAKDAATATDNVVSGNDQVPQQAVVETADQAESLVVESETAAAKQPKLGEKPAAPADQTADQSTSQAVPPPNQNQPIDASTSTANSTTAPLAVDATTSPPRESTLTPIPTAPQPAGNAARFTEVNHPQIISGIRGQVGEAGGSMQIRLDPPELGALLINVTMREGLVDATFQTANAEATQLLSHSLAQLKHSLENQGVNVDRLQVAQTAPPARNEKAHSDSSNSQQNGNQNNSQQAAYDPSRGGDQQRREMIRRMWAKLGAGDPLDLVA